MRPWASERRAKISVVRTITTVLGPLLVLGTMGLGLRLGAEPAGIAALVVPAPLPATKDRLAWQVRALYEERRIREPAPALALEVRARTRDGKPIATWTGVTNVEGIAEATLVSPGFAPAPGATIDIEVRSTKDRTILARGPVQVPADPEPTRMDPLRPTRVDGPLAVSVFAPPGGIAPQFANVVWIQVRDASGAAVSGARLAFEADPGLEIKSTPAPTCAAGYTSLVVQGIGHVFGLRATATAPAGATGAWYGALPVVPGGDEITFEPRAPTEAAPLTVRVRTASAKPLVYVEIVDDVGRELAVSAAVVESGGFGEATVTIPSLPRGKHFAVVSSRPDGFHLGTAVARAFRVGAADGNSCEGEAELGVRPPPSFLRTPVLDGFGLRREEAARTRRKGMFLAVGSLVTGGILAALMLASSLHRSRPRFELWGAEPSELEAMTRSTTPRWLVVALLVGLSCLAYFLLAALVLYSGN